MQKEITMEKAMFLNKNLPNSNVGDEKIDLDSIILPILIDTYFETFTANKYIKLIVYLFIGRETKMESCYRIFCTRSMQQLQLTVEEPKRLE